MHVRRIIVLNVCMVTMICGMVFSQVTDPDIFIYRIEMSFDIETTQNILIELDDITPTHRDTEKVLQKALLLFRKALLLLEETQARTTYDFLDAMYNTIPEYQIPVVLALAGAMQAFIAGTLTSPNPIPKMTLLKKGTDMLDLALETQKKLNKTDYLALGYIYFLRGKTMSSVPSFIKISEDAPKNLKTALSYYKKVKNIHPTIISNVFYAYGDFYLNQGKIALAIKNMEKARKYADEYLLKEIEGQIEKLKE